MFGNRPIASHPMASTPGTATGFGTAFAFQAGLEAAIYPAVMARAYLAGLETLYEPTSPPVKGLAYQAGLEVLHEPEVAGQAFQAGLEVLYIRNKPQPPGYWTITARSRIIDPV